MSKREYVHLSLSERDLITNMLAEEKSLGEIAKALGRSKSTVSRELKRNATPAYRLYMSHRAHGRATERKKQANTHQRLKNERIEAYVRSMLKDGWSPELIACVFRHSVSSHFGLSVSTHSA